MSFYRYMMKNTKYMSKYMRDLFRNIPEPGHKIDLGQGLETVINVQQLPKKLLIETKDNCYCLCKITGKRLAEKVLIVDDTEDILTMMAEQFEALGHEVITANNGKDAERILDEAHITLLVSDLEMPEMDGIELMRWSKLNMPSTKRVLLSGNTARLNEDIYSDMKFSKPIGEEEVRQIHSLIKRCLP